MKLDNGTELTISEIETIKSALVLMGRYRKKSNSKRMREQSNDARAVLISIIAAEIKEHGEEQTPA